MSSTTQTLRNAVDTWAGSGRASTNHSDEKRLGLENGVAQAFIYFSRPFPLGSTVGYSPLRVHAKGAWGITPTLTVQLLGGPWKASRLTWINKPVVTGATVAKTQASSTDGTEWLLDVGPLLQSVADGARWYGLRIVTSSAVRKDLYSADSLVFRPTLDVTWSEAPQAPSTLSPSGGRVVSLTKPRLRFDFTDDAGNTSLQAVQVQLNATNVWTAPTFDSGTVTATVPELDLATTTYAGLADGASTYWRVRVQDGSGLWSGWSDAAQFTRNLKGTPAITNPAASPSNFVTESTPPLSHTFTGETQEAWQYDIYDAATNANIHSSFKRVGTEVAYTPPKGVLKDGRLYKLIVFVWGTRDREATPGDPPWVSAERLFTVNEDATTAAVTNLVASSTTPEPWVTLTFNRATAPDSFEVVRDGKVVDSGIVPSDVLVSGTAYRIVNYTAAPNRSHTWKVRPVVNGKAAASNPTVTYKAAGEGIWLREMDRGITVRLGGGLGSTWGAGESGETHLPLGARRPVRITQVVRGVEGSITDALLTDDAGQTALVWESRLLDIKSRPGSEVILSYGAQAFPVVVSDIVIRPWTEQANSDYSLVSFNFWQVGAFPDVVL